MNEKIVVEKEKEEILGSEKRDKEMWFLRLLIFLTITLYGNYMRVVTEFSVFEDTVIFLILFLAILAWTKD